MNLIFMRHGEATDNVKEIISDREIYWSVLTEKGIETIKETIKQLPPKIDKIYVSPFPRTIQTAYYATLKYPKTETVIDNRLREIYYGKYSGKRNNKELDEVRVKQISGDYFTKFGDYGENKHEIETRLCSFLDDLKNNNQDQYTILIISHGSVMAYIKRILSIKSLHLKTGKFEIASNINFDYLNTYKSYLKDISIKNINNS